MTTQTNITDSSQQKTHLMSYLDESVQQYSEKTAFSDGVQSITFQQASDYGKAIASYLIDQGGGSEPVVVFMNRGPFMPTAFFGVLYAGKYYVPLDQEMPRFRIELILQEVKPRFIICDQENYETARDLVGEEKLLLFEQLIETNVQEESLAAVRKTAIDTDPAYIVFTSGSTGVPKGVVACHRSVIHYIENLCDILKVKEDTVFGNQTPLYLDACLKEIFGVLKCGATAYILPRQLFMFPIKLVEFITTHQINTVCWVVSALTMISGLNVLEKNIPHTLKTIAFASEIFPVKQFRRWQKALPGSRFINFYGPTEATGVCCFYEVKKEIQMDDFIPIGKPFPNTDIFLLSDENKKARQGEPGEICIRGTALTMGYYHNEAKTAQSFVQNPLNSYFSELIYRTGDIGIQNDEGDFIFISRKDNQIKHMGHRIELGEIEAAALMVEGIEHAGSLFDSDKQKIWLFYNGQIEPNDAKRELKEKLPRYMMPHQVLFIEKMPLTANHKLDRQALKRQCLAIKNERKSRKEVINYG